MIPGMEASRLRKAFHRQVPGLCLFEPIQIPGSSIGRYVNITARGAPGITVRYYAGSGSSEKTHQNPRTIPEEIAHDGRRYPVHFQELQEPEYEPSSSSGYSYGRY
jgi:hypothetical protein